MSEAPLIVADELQCLFTVRRGPVEFIRGKASRIHAVDTVSFTLERAEILALVGESGCGKSTVGRMLVKMEEPTAGALTFAGETVNALSGARLKEFRRRAQMIFQNPFEAFDPRLTIGTSLQQAMQIHNIGKDQHDRLQRIVTVMERSGLTPAEDFLSRYPHELSGGQSQRIATVRVMLLSPEFVVADEPVSMLDVSIRVGVLNLMKRLADDSGLSFLYITHDIASARYISDHTNVMYAGRMVEGAPSDELVHEPAHPYTRLLLSAVPNPHAGLRTQETVARGEIPSLIDPPPGCPFAARCPHVMPVCREVMPNAVTIAPNHWVRCHLYGDGGVSPLPTAANSVG